MDGVRRIPRTRGPRRGRGARVRDGRTAPPPVVEEDVDARGRDGRGGRADQLRSTKRRPAPRTNDKLTLNDDSEMPVGQGLETPLHPKRRRVRQPSDLAPSSPPPSPTSSTSSVLQSPQQNHFEFVVAGTSDSPVGEVAPPHSPTFSWPSLAMFVECVDSSPSSLMQQPRLGQSLRNEDIEYAPGYGSEAGSDESDDDELVSPFIPRVFRSVLETPMEAEDDACVQPTENPASASTSEVPPTATDRPWSLFDFEWKPFPNAPIPHESRRETFSQSNIGPTTPYVDPYDNFVAIWDRQFMEHIASETNRYAQQMATQMLNNHKLHPNSRIGSWRDTTVDELYVYFGLIIAMGVVIKARMHDYWSATPDVFYTPGFSVHMSKNRFLLLSRCLHFSNNEDMCALSGLNASEVKLFKIQPVLSHLNIKFQSLYNLRQNIALDESLLQWKGWLDINQLIPKRAATVGIKTYELCEPQTGYLWRFEVHAHKRSPPQQSEDPLNSSTPAIVLRLTHGLENKGHTLWMDNFYSSPCLARRLKALGMDCVGTLRTNRQFVPQALHSLTKECMQPGQITGLTSGDVDVMVWRDNNRVSMISTYHGNAAVQVRDSTKPILISDYNIMMGGVDKKDQMLAKYPIERKQTKVWYKKLFRRLLNVSILNSYIIHRQSSPSSLSHRNFRIALVKSLLSKHCSAAPIPPIETKHNQRVDLTHRLGEYPFRKGQRQKRVCNVCRKRVSTFCLGCKKTVCMDPCFLTMHLVL